MLVLSQPTTRGGRGAEASLESERRALTDYEQKAGAPTLMRGEIFLLLEEGVLVKHERVGELPE